MRTTCIHRYNSNKTNVKLWQKKVEKSSNAICAKFKTYKMYHFAYVYIHIQQKDKNLNMEDKLQLWGTGCLWSSREMEVGPKEFSLYL